MFQQSATVDTDEDMKKCVESADTIKYTKDVATQFNYLIPLRGILLLLVWLLAITFIIIV